MSEFNRNTERADNLFAFAKRLIDGDNGKLLIEQYKPYIETITPAETMQVFDSLLVNGYSNQQVKANVGKLVNVFFKSISAQTWEKPGNGHFIFYLMQENRKVEKLMERLKTLNKSVLKLNEIPGEKELNEFQEIIHQLTDYELHYVKKENILFPFIEKTFPQFRCLQLMWSFHDDFRQSLRILKQILSEPKPSVADLNTELGKLFFVVLPIIFREEQIVFPVALRAIPENSWAEMLQQSFEIGWCYGVKPHKFLKQATPEITSSGQINLGTGMLHVQQLILMLNQLPVDLTYVDENDEVAYFSGSKHRIFPRSNAIIGRKVQNCHPPESVHIVNEIVEAFRSGKKDEAEFWIQMREKFIHIRYYALRSDNGTYKGTLEVSQDVTFIRELTGEQRLLSWNK